ncbi:TRAP transporter large permease [Marasmitruncus massiliensis]|uniref:TRAP transporter large permease n=1 Tax=Marasmitruncus massiliensis TaxID=1944642 RepID=UPI000C7DB407|nr:TRAP transporter large permease subunit [Marasmitruncus massiliensis]MBE6907805.1 TRAP transporter large permease subunit [Oscillospiraceae bacterium]
MIAVFITFLVLLAIGVPVAYAIGASGMVFFFLNTQFPFTHIAQLPITQTQNITMLAIPLFILAGNLMNNGGVTKRLVSLATMLTGHMRGGLAQTSVVLSTLMGGCSGSATADAAMEARLLGPDMLKNGYSKGFSANVLTFTSLITATIPPGVGLIIYGTTGSVSIGKLFAAGIFVGLFMMIVLMVTVAVTARMRGYKPVRETRATIREIILNLKETIWAVMFPVILLVGIRMGLFSPSEVGAFACFYAVFVGIFIYKELTFETFLAALRDSIYDIGSIMMIVSLTALFGYGIPVDKIPQKMTSFMTGITNSPALILLMIILLLVFIGMFMEGSVVILLLTPILLPMCKAVGIDPVHLGLLMCTIVTMGVNTPPVGMSMYTVNTILGCSLEEYSKSMVPFLAAILLAMGLLAFFPNVVLFLPNLLYR